ncbi:hypothetical protein AM305_05624 [Actinobacillus minor NM305]|uniref:Uncharacterized protein n=1 Tax=Actinobacillus minor NM305 TaxID=637911 RepID=C5RZN2_9PAST|nr:hypothetical protein AM305_05624 [Actinobacillus minor NM305]
MFELAKQASLKSSSQKLATSVGRRNARGRLSFAYFSLAKQRKVGNVVTEKVLV